MLKGLLKVGDTYTAMLFLALALFCLSVPKKTFLYAGIVLLINVSVYLYSAMKQVKNKGRRPK